MGGPSATDDLDEGHLTQTWLAVVDSSDAARTGSGWHHHRPARTADAARDTDFQERLLTHLAEMTGCHL